MKDIIASEHPDPAAQRKILFDYIEGITVAMIYARHTLKEMSSPVATFDLAANFRFGTFTSDWRRKEASQKKRRGFCDLLIKHQRLPNCL
jgi:hypothetical protein